MAPKEEKNSNINNRLKWENSYHTFEDFFGNSPSQAAISAVEVFKNNRVTKVLELGGGQGRDTLYFAHKGFQVYVLDYAVKGIKDIEKKAQELNLSNKITAFQHDVRNPLPFDDNFFDGCYSHLLCCMYFMPQELKFLFQEIKRVLNNGGIKVYTVRNKNDPHFGTGDNLIGNIYNINGFIIHFFDKKTIESLSKGFKILQIDEFEEGNLPRKIYSVVQKNEY